MPKPLLCLAITLLAITGCTHDPAPSPHFREDDTSKVLHLLIDSALENRPRDIPDRSDLTKNSPYKDSILFLADSIFMPYLAENSFPVKFKFLTEKELCSQATQFNHDNIYYPGFLSITHFEKTDSGYSVFLKNNCVIPQFDKHGHPVGFSRADTLKCIFNFLCGGGMSMTFKKQHDTMRGIIKGFLSD